MHRAVKSDLRNIDLTNVFDRARAASEDFQLPRKLGEVKKGFDSPQLEVCTRDNHKTLFQLNQLAGTWAQKFFLGGVSSGLNLTKLQMRNDREAMI